MNSASGEESMVYSVILFPFLEGRRMIVDSRPEMSWYVVRYIGEAVTVNGPVGEDEYGEWEHIQFPMDLIASDEMKGDLMAVVSRNRSRNAAVEG